MTANSAPYTVLITGASSGIGYELALCYLKQGAKVFVLARSEEPLAQLTQQFPGRCVAVRVDLSDADDSQRAGEWISQQVPFLDLAILNAGTCEYVDVNHLTREPFEKVMAINWQGTVNSLLFCLPLLRKKILHEKKSSAQTAQLVGISSMASILPMPRSQAYGASKVAVEYLFNSLRVDLVNEQIDITLVRPGFVKTPLTERNDFPMPFAQTTAEAAIRIMRGISKRHWLVQFPWPLVWLMNAIACLPLRAQVWLLQKISRNAKV
ncbi:SDR family NAD(P)-dependent oxidoreductase [Cellvibrio sp. OA-2007]|uniref:SDR family NAD(P)-dependent oxidoreductase n=1 Tax=Cellvibrio sp. OA-2007 TaxID=529823 RepID=UPI000783075E|nr:SDR family NAD(P)-dependent oxidoreductase [Cellvibrio sp. OA-2007]